MSCALIAAQAQCHPQHRAGDLAAVGLGQDPDLICISTGASRPRPTYPITCAKIAGWPGVRAVTDEFHAGTVG
jgi:hypothetical protein